MKIKSLIVFFIATVLITMAPRQADAQMVIIDVIKTATKKVIRAIDLKIQRLQNKTIDLQNIQKEIENKLSQLKLNEIAEWTKKQKEIYQQYFDELWRVKTAIAYYKRVAEIIAKQKQLVTEYKKAYSLVQQDKHFSADELESISAVYTGILEESIKHLDQILMVVQSFHIQMSDAARLEIINKSADALEQNYTDLQNFTQQNMQLSLQRAKDLHEVNIVKKLYGL